MAIWSEIGPIGFFLVLRPSCLRVSGWCCVNFLRKQYKDAYRIILAEVYIPMFLNLYGPLNFPDGLPGIRLHSWRYLVMDRFPVASGR